MVKVPSRVYVGTDPHMEKANVALEYSIQKFSSVPVEIVWMDYSRGGLWERWNIGRERGLPYSGQGWATDFSCFRFAIPEANGFQGRAIYLDADMIVLRDIKEVFEVPMTRPVSVTPNRFDVILFDCAAFKDLDWWPSIAEMKVSTRRVQAYQDLLKERDAVEVGLSADWNCQDGRGFDLQKTGLVHYTNMRTQPWKPYPNAFQYRDHPRPDMVALWEKFYSEAKQMGFE